MKKFKFRLQRVLDYRESLKKEKERELALRNSELKRAEDRLQEILTAQEEVDPFEGEMTMAELAMQGDYLYYLQKALVHQRELIVEATEAVEQARQAYIDKAVEAKSLDTLKQKQRSDYELERKRHERRETDKISVQRHRFKRGGLKQED